MLVLNNNGNHRDKNSVGEVDPRVVLTDCSDKLVIGDTVYHIFVTLIISIVMSVSAVVAH